MHPYPPLVRIAPKITAGIAAALGLLMAAAGLGLGFALLTSGQPPLQFATAAILLTTGAVNLASSRGLWKENRAALAASAAATATLLAYLAALGDFGELLIYHALYLLLLAALAYQRRSISAAA
jgi:hypothetical protein